MRENVMNLTSYSKEVKYYVEDVNTNSCKYLFLHVFFFAYHDLYSTLYALIAFLNLILTFTS